MNISSITLLTLLTVVVLTVSNSTTIMLQRGIKRRKPVQLMQMCRCPECYGVVVDSQPRGTVRYHERTRGMAPECVTGSRPDTSYIQPDAHVLQEQELRRQQQQQHERDVAEIIDRANSLDVEPLGSSEEDAKSDVHSDDSSDERQMDEVAQEILNAKAVMEYAKEVLVHYRSGMASTSTCFRVSCFVKYVVFLRRRRIIFHVDVE